MLFEIQRHLAKRQYHLQPASAIQTAVRESFVKDFAPNISDDYAGRLQAAWLDR